MRRAETIRDRLYVTSRVFLRPPGPWLRWRQFREYRREVTRGGSADNFEIRTRNVCAGADNAKIPRVEQAGQIVNGTLVMHNGIRVIPDSYLGGQMTRLLGANGGVHEPQEEFAFGEVLHRVQGRHLARHAMLELGAYWSFYSLWFATMLPGAKCYCVEPDANNLEFGEKNFQINGLTADFTHAFVGAAPKSGEPPTISVDSLIRDKEIDHLDILHSDIQGYELDMLAGAQESFARQLVDYVFISTHGHFLHYRCVEELEKAGFQILAEADMLETDSVDGVIVAGRKGLDRLDRIPVTPRRYGL